MPEKRKPAAASKKGQRAEGRKDIFARLDEDVVDKLDAMVDDMRPRTTRSALVAQLVEDYVAREWPEFEKRQKARTN